MPASIIKRYSGFGKCSIRLLDPHVKVFRPDAQHDPAPVVKRFILCALDCDDRADSYIGLQPVLNRLLGLILVGPMRLASFRFVKNRPFAWHAKAASEGGYAGRRTRFSVLRGFSFFAAASWEESGVGELCFTARALSASCFLSCCASRCLSP